MGRSDDAITWFVPLGVKDWLRSPGGSTKMWAQGRTLAMPAISAYNVYGNRGICWHCPLYQVLTTKKWLSASALGRWPLIAGNLTLKCVGTLIICPYMAGGRSRRGSPKAGTTVYVKNTNKWSIEILRLPVTGRWCRDSRSSLPGKRLDLARSYCTHARF